MGRNDSVSSDNFLHLKKDGNIVNLDSMKNKNSSALGSVRNGRKLLPSVNLKKIKRDISVNGRLKMSKQNRLTPVPTSDDTKNKYSSFIQKNGKLDSIINKNQKFRRNKHIQNSRNNTDIL